MVDLINREEIPKVVLNCVDIIYSVAEYSRVVSLMVIVEIQIIDEEVYLLCVLKSKSIEYGISKSNKFGRNRQYTIFCFIKLIILSASYALTGLLLTNLALILAELNTIIILIFPAEGVDIGYCNYRS